MHRYHRLLVAQIGLEVYIMARLCRIRSRVLADLDYLHTCYLNRGPYCHRGLLVMRYHTPTISDTLVGPCVLTTCI